MLFLALHSETHRPHHTWHELYPTLTTKPHPSEVEKCGFSWSLGHGPHLLPMKPMPSPINIMANVELALCGVAISSSCIKAMYNITLGTTTYPGNQSGIFEDLGDYYGQTNLNEFLLILNSKIPQGTKSRSDGIGGGTAPTNIANPGPEI